MAGRVTPTSETPVLTRAAPAPLDLVQAFVNTCNRMREYDRLESTEQAARWLQEEPAVPFGFASGRLNEQQLATLIALREQLRSLLLTNTTGEPLEPDTLQRLRATAADQPLLSDFTPDGTPQLQPAQTGPAGVGGIVLAAIAGSDPTEWSRLKVCRNPDCRWVFYDSSRNRTGTWCVMNVCGARAKMRRHRNTN